jgi:4-hydroxybenzoate polyprenyltransferase
MKGNKILKKIITIAVYSNAFLAVGSSCVAFVTMFLLGFPIEPVLLFIPFAGTMFIYNMNRHTDEKEDMVNVPDRTNFVNKNGTLLLILSSVLYFIAICFALRRNPYTFISVIFPTGVGVLYCVFRMKRYCIIKNLLVAVAWGITPVVVGFYFDIFNYSILSVSIIFALSFFINTVIFDIKDIEGDSLYGIKTLPAVTGLKITKYICLSIIVFIMIFLVFNIISDILPVISFLLIPFLMYITIYIILSKQTNSTFYYGIFVDGEFIFLSFIIIIVSLVNGWSSRIGL